jgi:hypothetical protein
MPFNLEDLREAGQALAQFRSSAVSPHHERYSFPFFSGSYFAYRKTDVLRVVAMAKALSSSPSYLDIGCGYGDFLRHVRGFLPDAEGIEKDGGIFYGLQVEKPDYIRIADAHWVDRKYDMIFVGWMEPGQDYRDSVARSTDVIVTTLDQGISLAAEFDGHGYQKIAWWRTPSWEDVNTEIMNRYYTKMPEERRIELAKMRGAHNLWYVYSKPGKAGIVKKALQQQIEIEPAGRYDFEGVLDECGYGYLQRLENPAVPEPLWQVQFT